MQTSRSRWPGTSPSAANSPTPLRDGAAVDRTEYDATVRVGYPEEWVGDAEVAAGAQGYVERSRAVEDGTVTDTTTHERSGCLGRGAYA
ncbi:hypothetical protein GCM10010215_26090 [Streptomyces virginiae]|uniref:Uncharacterized protein n=1 Tax=Streptomyces virginiae TaxID=1961 RepID=A0ABQ3NN57_STRVG|nr:hypothetical protein [Streptomyces virginiae]MBP2341912.1 hypothetical protein [Streptomyces virginiae]GGP99134.1 hypothetical protein GCM10010215_26090 [Streptomyces virginiae]GHI14212.1 hypothetical protein Scinn_36750 [Streptomyces virginiae]